MTTNNDDTGIHIKTIPSLPYIPIVDANSDDIGRLVTLKGHSSSLAPWAPEGEGPGVRSQAPGCLDLDPLRSRSIA